MYAQIISEATGVTDPKIVERIEDYMRHEIFHSTMDWQSREQLSVAARTAQVEIPMLDALLASGR